MRLLPFQGFFLFPKYTTHQPDRVRPSRRLRLRETANRPIPCRPALCLNYQDPILIMFCRPNSWPQWFYWLFQAILLSPDRFWISNEVAPCHIPDLWKNNETPWLDPGVPTVHEIAGQFFQHIRKFDPQNIFNPGKKVPIKNENGSVGGGAGTKEYIAKHIAVEHSAKHTV